MFSRCSDTCIALEGEQNNVLTEQYHKFNEQKINLPWQVRWLNSILEMMIFKEFYFL